MPRTSNLRLFSSIVGSAVIPVLVCNSCNNAFQSSQPSTTFRKETKASHSGANLTDNAEQDCDSNEVICSVLCTQPGGADDVSTQFCSATYQSADSNAEGWCNLAYSCPRPTDPVKLSGKIVPVGAGGAPCEPGLDFTSHAVLPVTCAALTPTATSTPENTATPIPTNTPAQCDNNEVACNVACQQPGQLLPIPYQFCQLQSSTTTGATIVQNALGFCLIAGGFPVYPITCGGIAVINVDGQVTALEPN